VNELEKYQMTNKAIQKATAKPSYVVVPIVVVLVLFLMNPWLVAVAGAAGIGGVALGRASK
jgi:small-conductance mechanosensitive channel